MAIPSLQIDQAKRLAGCTWRIGRKQYQFAPMRELSASGKSVPEFAGEPSKGIAYPLHQKGRATQWFKSVPATSREYQHRFRERMRWLIAQQLGTVIPELGSVPHTWVDGYMVLDNTGNEVELHGYLATQAKGVAWSAIREDASRCQAISMKQSWDLAYDLVRAHAVCESFGLAHGDLSPNNFFVDIDAAASAISWIDFDSFHHPDAFSQRAGDRRWDISRDIDGTPGTTGYSESPGESIENDYLTRDRRARDMLLLELLLGKHEVFWSEEDCCIELPIHWFHSDRRQELQRLFSRDPLLPTLFRTGQVKDLFEDEGNDPVARKSSGELLEAFNPGLPTVPRPQKIKPYKRKPARTPLRASPAVKAPPKAKPKPTPAPRPQPPPGIGRKRAAALVLGIIVLLALISLIKTAVYITARAGPPTSHALESVKTVTAPAWRDYQRYQPIAGNIPAAWKNFQGCGSIDFAYFLLIESSFLLRLFKAFFNELSQAQL